VIGEEDPLVVVALVEDGQRRSLSIELSDGTTLSVAANSNEARELNPGLELSALQHDALVLADERKRAARQVFLWLDRRPRTRHDLKTRLRNHEYSAASIETVLDQFETEGLVNDRDFAERWGRERLRNRPVGPHWLRGRLLKEGIDSDVVHEVVSGLYAEFEEAGLALRALGRKRFDCTEEKGRQRANRFLRSRGFSVSAVIEAIRQMQSGSY
jgi:regulatory protein